MPATIGAGKVHTASRASAALQDGRRRFLDGDDERMRLARRQHLGLHVARAHRGHRHAGAVQIDAQALAQRDEPGLRRRVGAEARQPAKAGDAGDGDDAPVAARDHPRHDAGDRRRRADEVGLEDRLDPRPVELLARRDPARAGVGDEKIDRAPRVDRAHRRVGRVAVADVEHERLGAAAAGDDLRHQLVEPLAPPRRDASRARRAPPSASASPRPIPDDAPVTSACFTAAPIMASPPPPTRCATTRPMPQQIAVPTSPVIIVSIPARSSGRCVSRALTTPTVNSATAVIAIDANSACAPAKKK